MTEVLHPNYQKLKFQEIFLIAAVTKSISKMTLTHHVCDHLERNFQGAELKENPLETGSIAPGTDASIIFGAGASNMHGTDASDVLGNGASNMLGTDASEVLGNDASNMLGTDGGNVLETDAGSSINLWEEAEQGLFSDSSSLLVTFMIS